MPFKVNARTILHLGAELISSDAIAFFELIKNAFDAKSKRVRINVVVRLNFATASEFVTSASLINGSGPYLQFRSRVLAAIDPRAQEIAELRASVSAAKNIKELVRVIEEANYIEFEDTGDGMSLSDLDGVYLTIGTRDRLEQREQRQRAVAAGSTAADRPVLGEKGVGRLSAMRLGRRLHVRTSRAGESYWNILDIDWGWFSHDSDKYLEQIPVDPTRGPEKEDRKASGTVIRICALTSDWNVQKLEDIAAKEFSKLTDPFLPKTLYPITLRFNGDAVPIRRLNDVIFEQAHATVEVQYTIQEGPRLATKMNYRRYGKSKTVVDEGAHLLSAADVTLPSVLTDLGPFTMQMYWFNRRILTAVDGIGDLSVVRELVAQWSGGLMVYRDGFRVYPYGGPDDDWLDLDRKAFGSAGYKVNRGQIVGKVDISAVLNPRLTDQTNREGLRECPETEALRGLLKHVLRQQFKPFLDDVDAAEKNKERLTFSDIGARVEEQERHLQLNIQALAAKFPALKSDPKILEELRNTSKGIRDVMDQASLLAESFEKGRTQLIHLAGLGLMVEIVAHELNRATSNTLATLADAREHSGRVSFEDLIPSLEAQLKTLQKRLRILDPLTTAGRQVKETFDVVDLVRDVIKGHAAQFRRHSIRHELHVTPSDRGVLRMKMVRGMVVQVVENLISNSVYWLKQQQRYEPSFKPILTIAVDISSKEISVHDNGPGVDPDRKDDIFEAFVTTKPPGEGKGLGLYISKEIAMYHGASLYMSERRSPHRNKLNTFIFALEGK